MTEPKDPFRPLSNEFLTDLFRDPLDPGYADAAARRADGRQAGPSARRGLRAATLAALAAVGMLLAVAYQQVVAEEPTRAQVRADLEEQIHDREAETQDLQERADQLRDEVAELRDQQLGDPEQVERLRELEAVTGLGRVRGDGVVVRVNDGPPGVDPQTGEPALDPLARILDRDLQRIANALWEAGAEAIAINGRRLTATSTIRGASGAILIDRQPIAGPYEVVAVGPEELRDRFAGSETGRLMQVLVDDYGITYELRTARDVTLPAASEPRLYHATPAGGS
jgi:uncharacterized protein YlxW (UPF0749 family)